MELFNEHYGLVQPEQLVIVRSYGDDTDDQVLAEIRPRFIIMYEPNLEFVRRIEVSGQFLKVVFAHRDRYTVVRRLGFLFGYM